MYIYIYYVQICIYIYIYLSLSVALSAFQWASAMNASCAEADLAADRWPRACVEVVGASLLSLDWFAGTSTGNHGFPVIIPLNQSNDPCLLVEDLTDHTRLPAYSAVKWNAP